MFRLFEGKTADGAWQRVATAFRARDGTVKQDSREGPTLEILHAALSIEDPRQRWVASRNPPFNIALALAETVWIMAGRNDSAFLTYFSKELIKFAGDGPTFHGAYGFRLRRHFGIDQLQRAYEALRNNPLSRQVALQIWDAAVDLPNSDGSPVSKDVPCNLAALLKVRDGQLHWTQIMRSNDLFRGLPYNVVQFTTLQEILSGWLGLQPGPYHHMSDSLHVYEREIEQIEASQARELPANTDQLSLPKQTFETVFAELHNATTRVIDEKVSAEQLLNLVKQTSLPAAYRNVLAVLSAEGARRRKNVAVAALLMAECTNPLFRELFEAWSSRFPDSHGFAAARS
jgi:thymidylate synthase